MKDLLTLVRNYCNEHTCQCDNCYFWGNYICQLSQIHYWKDSYIIETINFLTKDEKMNHQKIKLDDFLKAIYVTLGKNIFLSVIKNDDGTLEFREYENEELSMILKIDITEKSLEKIKKLYNIDIIV